MSLKPDDRGKCCPIKHDCRGPCGWSSPGTRGKRGESPTLGHGDKSVRVLYFFVGNFILCQRCKWFAQGLDGYLSQRPNS